MESNNQNTNSKEVVITHIFNAERAVVFKAWTDPELLQQWFAPGECTIEYKSLDVRSGGKYHSVIRDKVHGDCWVIGEYLEVKAPELLVFTSQLADADAKPLDQGTGVKSEWPTITKVTVTFEDLGAQTKVMLHQNVSEELAKQTGAYPSWIIMLEKLERSLELGVGS